MTFGGQSTHAITLERKGCERHILMLDIWRPKNAIDGRHAWLPVEWEGGKPVVRRRDRWPLAGFGCAAVRTAPTPHQTHGPGDATTAPDAALPASAQVT